MTKSNKSPFLLFGTTLLHEHVKYIFTVYAKYQIVSVKDLFQVDFSVYMMYVQSKHNSNTGRLYSQW